MASGQKPFYIVLGVLVLAGIAFIGIRMMGSGSISIPANVVVTTADTSGFRGYVTGVASAPLEVTEYGDLECPVCATFATVQFPEIKARLIDTGKIRYRYRDFPLDGPHRHPRVAAHAAACANDQGKYWDVQAAMFQNQMDYAEVADPIPPLRNIMKNAGLNTDTWEACMKSAKYAGRIQASLNEGTVLGVNSTPTFLIAGRLYPGLNSDRMIALVDSVTATLPSPPAGSVTPTGGQ
ncbi:MAG TPA: thioredoxin domain-containing protein [Gemmatimonadales bacterium]|jgi:protein-disulfide isomerase